MNIFIDSSFLIAMFDRNDINHQKAIDISKKYPDNTLFFDDLVKYESVNVLLKKSIPHAKKLNALLYSGLYQRISITDSTWQIAFSKIITKFSKSGPNVFDYIHFACMQEYGLKDVLTFDHHFTTAGFNVLK
ncbi:PIN domain-containing protein [Candidatus Shapirobacteria bacterium]|nr:PIN domain-containing protein [Candidatus Shapirobacteria bacterium]